MQIASSTSQNHRWTLECCLQKGEQSCQDWFWLEDFQCFLSNFSADPDHKSENEMPLSEALTTEVKSAESKARELKKAIFGSDCGESVQNTSSNKNLTVTLDSDSFEQNRTPSTPTQTRSSSLTKVRCVSFRFLQLW